MQQADTTLIYWAPSRVRFNLTLILATVVVVIGLLQMPGFDPLAAICSPPAARAPEGEAQDGTAPAAGETQETGGGSGRGSAWLLVLVGLGVGAYSWLTTPRQYRVYSDALIIMFGTPRRRTIHFSEIREVANDRGFMGDPLRVYTVNRRRIPIQVREPEEMHRYLDSALADFRRANPQYAPPPEPAGDGDAPDVVDSTVTDAPEPAGPPEQPEAEAPPAPEEPAPQRSPRSRRRSLRDDGDNTAGRRIS